jgi:hypothetical protein
VLCKEKELMDMDEKYIKSIIDRLSKLNIDYTVPNIAIILEH